MFGMFTPSLSIVAFDRRRDVDDRLATLRGLIGRIPSNPLWAEVLSRQQREEDEKRRLRKTGSSQSLRKQARQSQILATSRVGKD